MATSKFKSMVMIKFQEINLFLNFIDYFCNGDKIEKHFMRHRVILKMTPRHAFVYQYRGYSLNEAGRLGVRWMKVNLPIFHAFWGQIFCPKTLDFYLPVKDYFCRTHLLIIGQKTMRARVPLICLS